MSSTFRILAAATLAAGVFACKSAPAPKADDDGDQAGEQPSSQDVAIASEAAAPGRPGPGEEVIEFDYNNDRRPDVYKFYAQGTAPRGGRSVTAAKDGSGGDSNDRPLRTESDLNGDGRIDVWTWYARDGAVDRSAYDLDFDSHVDVTAFFEKGVVVRKEVFHGFGEKPDTFKYFEKGKLQRIERDRNNDGRIDTWEYWENDQIDRIGEDANADGTVDRWIKPKKGGP